MTCSERLKLRSRPKDRDVPILGDQGARVVRPNIDGRKALVGRLRVLRWECVREFHPSQRLARFWLYRDGLVHTKTIREFVGAEVESTLLTPPSWVPAQLERDAIPPSGNIVFLVEGLANWNLDRTSVRIPFDLVEVLSNHASQRVAVLAVGPIARKPRVFGWIGVEFLERLPRLGILRTSCWAVPVPITGDN